MSLFKVGLIGLGKIAADYGSPADEAPYCHAGGLWKAGRFELAGAADLSESARQNFHSKWGQTFPHAPLFGDISSLLESGPLDVVAVCVRGPHHLPVMRQVFAARPRLIFLEKPPTCSLEEMDELLALSRESGIPIVVSYSRHWAPRVLAMERAVREGAIGRVHSVVGYCGGPVLSYASHTTDLICQFAMAQSGAYAPVAVASVGVTPNAAEAVPPEWRERGYKAEPHLRHLSIEFADGIRGVQIGGRGEGGEFYVDVFGDEGRARGGMYLAPQLFDSKNQPLDFGEIPKSQDAGPFAEAYRQVASYLDGGPLPDCTGQNFVAINEIGFGAIESLLNGGERVELPNIRRDRKIYANG